MKLSKGGNFLNGKNAKDGETVKFLDEGEIIPSERYKYDDGSPQKNLIFKVEYKGEEKQVKITKQSKVALMDTWGEETKNWVGKSATIFVFPTPDGSNKTIVLKPIVQMNPENIDWNP